MFTRAESVPCDFDTGDVSVTKQSFKDECDINNILRQYQMTGVISHLNEAQPQYADLPDPIDYQDALHQVQAAEAAFYRLPKEVRERYGNDPAGLLQALANPAEAEFLREAGILAPLAEAGASPAVDSGVSGAAAPTGAQG
jgi:phage internal scaffolding protein